MSFRNNNVKHVATMLLSLVLLVNFAPNHITLATPPALADKVISIADARSLPLGTIVTIDGSVTVASGAFNSSTFDQGFAIQDRTGGIYVSTSDNLGFAPRQQVRVTGTLADTVLPGLLVLVDVTSAVTHGNGPKVQPLTVATGDVSEATEGKIVSITGTITQPIVNDLPFGFIIVVNDGSGEINVFVWRLDGHRRERSQPGPDGPGDRL